MFLTARGEFEAAAAELAAAEELATGDIDPDVQAYLLQATAEAALAGGAARGCPSRRRGSRWPSSPAATKCCSSAPLLVLGLTAAADLADHGRAFRDPPAVAAAQAAAEGLVDQARSLAASGPTGATPTPSVTAAVATVEAERTRLDGRSDAAAWLTAAEAWDAVPMPFAAAQARARAG